MESHDELLEAAAAAFYQYEKDVEEARKRRTEAFAKALRGTVTGRELASRLDISPTYVSKIYKGQR
ncbi:hypothetical protein [Corynebacterium marquesiae]|uniref:hypothetical protein n=1 Tax=Corynebacterium marquesiae TaxID=2913503 RepID=UPI0038D003A2